ncbi:hypothetical protein E5347_15295 [Clostridium sartagoforme]|uniref:DUF4306 domain-containing protein n=1 Tax=Clostridium sartagoforme TaxID=84031 RepID=A0A4S2DHN4_9CLOT|nr:MULTISPECIES: hypothetical protein [Clostridium]MBS5939535.1 hypothetical protein [Clostridium sp.]TGY40334.1 hypothetical protein E5347_15295 [Clostridium sartagoforme]
MRETTMMNKRIFYLIVGLCAVIIMSYSLEAFAKAKDIGLFENWLNNPNLNIDRSQSMDESYSLYLTTILSVFFIRIITPVALSLNTYFAFIKLKVNKLFILIWTILIIGLFALTLIGEAYFSLFLIISGICYLGILVTLMYLWKEINNENNIKITSKIQQG